MPTESALEAGRGNNATAGPSRSGALFESLVVVVVAFLTRSVLRHFGAGIGGGVASTVIAVAVATWLLWRHGQRWSALGIARPPSLRVAAIWTAGLAIADVLLVPLATSILADAFRLPTQRLEAFANLRGNLLLYLVLLVPVSWGAAAFGEELLFRGFLARRLTEAFGGTARAEVLANVIQATLFALGHLYLGPRGVLNAAALGLLAGWCYRANGRNLWPLFIAHGIVDSVGMTVLFLGLQHA